MATSTTGSTLLQPLSNAVRLPVDQVNFVVCQLFALLAAIWFRTYLHSSKTSPFVRHVVATLLGLYLALFCFGWYALHFVIQSGISYYIMIIIGVENMHKIFYKGWRIQTTADVGELHLVGWLEIVKEALMEEQKRSEKAIEEAVKRTREELMEYIKEQKRLDQVVRQRNLHSLELFLSCAQKQLGILLKEEPTTTEENGD